MIFERMRTWVVKTTEAARTDDPDNLQHSMLTRASMRRRNICPEQRLVVLGLSHPDTVFSISGLAGLYYRQGQYEDAEPLPGAAPHRPRGEPPGHSRSDWQLGQSLCWPDEAEPFFVACLEQHCTSLGESYPDTLRSMNNLVTLYADLDQYDDAEPCMWPALSSAASH